MDSEFGVFIVIWSMYRIPMFKILASLSLNDSNHFKVKFTRRYYGAPTKKISVVFSRANSLSLEENKYIRSVFLAEDFQQFIPFPMD